MLDQFLAINVFHFLLIFARLSVVFAMMPGVSAGYMPARFRLLIAVMVTIIMLPLLKDSLPPQPTAPADLAWLILAEVLIGGFLGGIVQILMSALETAGDMISTATGLTNAFVDDLVSEEQTAIVVGLLNIVAVVLIFTTGAHELLFSAVIDSYSLMAPGSGVMTGDILNLASTLLVQAFYMGIKLAAPFLVFEIVFQVANGVLARLSPQLNVFFVALPLQNLIGFAILLISLPTMLLIFLGFFENHLENLLVPVGVNG
jgi:flagellar biosynthetic protein FliR